MRRIYFVGQAIPNEIYNKHYDSCKRIQNNPANVYYNAVLTGLAQNGAEVTYRTNLPKELKDIQVDWENVRFIASVHDKNPIVKLVKNFLQTVRDIKKWAKEYKKGDFVLFNILRIGQAMSGMMMCKLLGLKSVAIVTDVPGYRINQKKFSITDYIGKKLLGKYDYYILLSDAMREAIKKDQSKVAIIEGIFEAKSLDDKTERVKSENEFTVLYAGSLEYMYGVMELVHAVQKIENENIVLKIYGKGGAEDEIKRISEKDPRIKFLGQTSHTKILEEEANADLLVNPRPVDEEYVKFSFPSKNMEYMASGTPVLLTDIPSLPEEYKEFVTLAKNNDSNLLSVEIEKIMKAKFDGDDEYITKATKARAFILENKNEKMQTKKILELVK